MPYDYRREFPGNITTRNQMMQSQIAELKTQRDELLEALILNMMAFSIILHNLDIDEEETRINIKTSGNTKASFSLAEIRNHADDAIAKAKGNP